MQKLTTLGDKEIKVIRRFRKYPGSKAKWWFLLKSDEEVLADLERQWNGIELQTKWKLEPCFRPADADEDEVGSHVPPQNHETAPPSGESSSASTNTTSPSVETIATTLPNAEAENSSRESSHEEPDAGESDPTTNKD